MRFMGKKLRFIELLDLRPFFGISFILTYFQVLFVNSTTNMTMSDDI